MTQQVSITPLDEMTDLSTRWGVLFERSQNSSFFLSPAWIESWISQAAPYAALFVVEITGPEGPDLLGIVGMGAKPNVPLLGQRELRLHETGLTQMDSIYIEYNDFLVARNAPAQLRELAWETVLDKFPEASSFVVQNALPALCNSLFAVAGRKGFTCRTVNENPVYVCDIVTLRRQGDTVLAHLSKNTRKQVERAIRLYEERGPVMLKVAGTAQEQATAWGNLQHLHNIVWEGRGRKGVFDNPDLMAFHERLRQTHPQSTQLVELYAGDELIGCLYNFVQEKRVMNYQSGFQYSDDNRLKPGLVMHVMAAQYYLEQGFEIYDMLAGEMRYKQSLGELSETLSLIEVERPGIKTSLRQLTRSLRKKIS